MYRSHFFFFIAICFLHKFMQYTLIVLIIGMEGNFTLQMQANPLSCFCFLYPIDKEKASLTFFPLNWSSKEKEAEKVLPTKELSYFIQFNEIEKDM